MIELKKLLNIFKKNKCDFFTGVPDSCLKILCNSLEKLPKKKHLIAVNEGAAVSIGIGYYLSEKKIPCIYMQNSGLSNAINPLISIAHNSVYSIPLILIIGWRGAPNSKDEPQHMNKGKITRKLLNLLNIKNLNITKNQDLRKLDKLIKYSKKNNKIVACLIKPEVLSKSNTTEIKSEKKTYIDKENFLKLLLRNLKKKSKIISSTGYTSRELFYVRQKYKIINGDDFYMVGGMGHTSSVALGFSLKSNNEIICLDGDGSLLMHMGAIKTIGDNPSSKLKYILLNNNSHESVGGQKTNAFNVNFNQLSKSLGFKKYEKIYLKKNINNKIKNFLKKKGPSFLEVKIGSSIKTKLPRPKNLIKIKNKFMN